MFRALLIATAPAMLITSIGREALAASPPKIGCLSGFVYRDAKNGDGVCVTPEERAAAKTQNVNARNHTTPSGACKSGFVWRDAWDGDGVCVTPAERAAAKVQNQKDAMRSQYAGVAVPVQPAPPPAKPRPPNPVYLCKSGFVWRDAKDGDGICVTPTERAIAKQQNANAASRTTPSGGCKSGFVWRDAWDGDGTCVTPAERSAAKLQNIKSASRSNGIAGAGTPPPVAEPKPSKHTDADGDGNKTNCKSSFVWRDPQNNDFICVTRTERALTQKQNAEAAQHTTESGGCRPGYVWREAWDGDVTCVTKGERALALAQNALQGLRSTGGDGGMEQANSPSRCKPGFVPRNAGKSDVVCVTRAERKIAWRQNENGPNNATASGGCRSGYVWRDAWDGDGVCVTPTERSEAKAQNARDAQNVAN